MHALSVFFHLEELNKEVLGEIPPHPDEEFHISLGWSPDRATPIGDTKGVLSLPDGMSGSPLWNTRYQETMGQGKAWMPEDARIVGIVWGHSAKARQIYATPIEACFSRLFV